MTWYEAIEKSEKGTATRSITCGDRTYTYIRYKDGSCYRLVSVNGVVDYNLSEEAGVGERDGYVDWEPSK